MKRKLRLLVVEDSDEDAFLYGFTDWPAQKALGQFYFEEVS